MDIVPLDDLSQPARQVMDIDNYSHVIFISANAVRIGMDLIENYWPQLPVDVTFYAIGSATANALIARGVPCVSGSGAMNSEALLQSSGLQAGPHLNKVLIMRGVGGRETLAETLQTRGAIVSYCELYERRAPFYEADVVGHLLNTIQINCWLASSAETLKNGLSLAGDKNLAALCKVPVVVPGQRVADIAKNAGCSHVVVAENAGTEAVLSALKSLM
jgi:uroporphyrinogen-III synthase